MNSIRRRRRGLLTGVLLAVVFTATAASAAEPGERCTQSSPTVTIGLSQRSFSYLPTVLGQAKGFYCDEGLNVVNTMISDGAAPPAVVGGNLDYVVNVANVVAAAASGLDLKMVAMVTSKPYFVLIAPSTVKSVKDLKGMYIGITSPGSSTQSMLTAVLAANGMTANDVYMQPLGNAQGIVAALFSNQIQAGMIYPPFDVQAVGRGFVRLVQSKEVTNVPLNALVTSGANIRQKPDQVMKVTKGTLRALHYIQTDREGTMAVMESSFGLAPDLVGEMYDTYKDIFSPDGVISDVQAQAAIDDARSRLPTAASLTTDKLVDRSLLAAARKDMGF
jgi:NitT/TauT family transport system substrate-binding protein